jgi:hypothetical protein
MSFPFSFDHRLYLVRIHSRKWIASISLLPPAGQLINSEVKNIHFGEISTLLRSRVDQTTSGRFQRSPRPWVPVARGSGQVPLPSPQGRLLPIYPPNITPLCILLALLCMWRHRLAGWLSGLAEHATRWLMFSSESNTRLYLVFNSFVPFSPFVPSHSSG